MIDRSLFDLSGRTAVVTGGASGLGRAASMGLAAFGANVAIADINETGAAETVERIAEQGTEAISVACDVSDADAVERLFVTADRQFGRIDILVNAALDPPHREPPERFPTDALERSLRVNLVGYFLCAREAGRMMIEAGRSGSIINISSIAGSSALGRGNFAYSIAKHGVHGLTRELALEWAQHGIRVNAIQPCQFDTPALRPLLEDQSERARGMVSHMLAGIPMGHLGRPEEIVGPIVFLASDAASMVTGAFLPVDGGNLAMNAGASSTW